MRVDVRSEGSHAVQRHRVLEGGVTTLRDMRVFSAFHRYVTNCPYFVCFPQTLTFVTLDACVQCCRFLGLHDLVRMRSYRGSIKEGIEHHLRTFRPSLSSHSAYTAPLSPIRADTGYQPYFSTGLTGNTDVFYVNSAVALESGPIPVGGSLPLVGA